MEEAGKEGEGEEERSHEMMVVAWPGGNWSFMPS